MDEVLARLAHERGGERAGDAQRKIGRRRRRHLVADVGEGDETVEQVIAVLAPADDVEIEIELCRRALADFHRAQQLSRR